MHLRQFQWLQCLFYFIRFIEASEKIIMTMVLNILPLPRTLIVLDRLLKSIKDNFKGNNSERLQTVFQ